MPAFPFAAHATLRCGLIPLLCDIDPATWLPCPKAKHVPVAHYGEAIAVIVSCTDSGGPFDRRHDEQLASTISAAMDTQGLKMSIVEIMIRHKDEIFRRHHCALIGTMSSNEILPVLTAPRDLREGEVAWPVWGRPRP